jgi:uncharacterized ferritin-like protein (DUF455 family)
MLPSVSPSKPPPSTIFGLRQARLLGYAYAAVRSMELAAAWVASTPKTSDKVVIATKLGVDGSQLGRLTARAKEMFVFEVVPEAPAAYAANFDHAATLLDRDSQLGFLAAVSRDLIASMAVYTSTQRDCADEPSVFLLAALQVELEHIAKRLEAASSSARRFDIVPYESTLGTALVAYTGREPIPELVAFPGRDEVLTFAEEQATPPPKRGGAMFKREALAPFFHNMFVDVEIPATEVCARALVEYRDMPLDFKMDMARQAWDEARHAVLTIDALQWAGGKEGDHPFHAAVWRRYLQGEGLAEKLAIQQLLQEGNSCDKAVTVARTLRLVGHSDVADMLDQLIADEVCHVRFGNRWVMHLCNGSQADYEAVMARAHEKVKFPMGPVNDLVRTMGGFPPWYVGTLRENFERILSGAT